MQSLLRLFRFTIYRIRYHFWMRSYPAYPAASPAAFLTKVILWQRREPKPPHR